MMQVYRTGEGIVVVRNGEARLCPSLGFDAIFISETPALTVEGAWSGGQPAEPPNLTQPLPAPIASQEVWAAGVTYFRSRTARMEESEGSGADRFYDLVYDAARPEIFFKGTGSRARGHRQNLRFRLDSHWNVPEPELTLAISARGKIFGYCIANDMSSRDIEGENPLYLPQAKVYAGSLGLGPCLTICDPLPPETNIRIAIQRAGVVVFSGETNLSQLKRPPQELADWLFRENEFPHGTYLLTGTGIVPPGQWTLADADVVTIHIDHLGFLENPVTTALPA